MADITPIVVNFAVAAGFVFYKARKPVVDGFKSRSQGIKKVMKEAEEAFSKADSDLKKWEGELSTADSQAKQLMEDAAKTVENHRTQVIEAANNQVTRMKEDTKRLGENEVERARKDLQKSVAQESLKLTKDFLEKSLGDKERKKLVEDSLQMVRS